MLREENYNRKDEKCCSFHYLCPIFIALWETEINPVLLWLLLELFSLFAL